MLDFRCTWMAPKTGGEPVERSKFPAMECQLCHVGKKKKKREREGGRVAVLKKTHLSAKPEGSFCCC